MSGRPPAASGAAPPLPMPDLPPAVAALPDAARLEWLWAEYEKQVAESKSYEEEGMDIFPTPGLVVKSVMLSAPTRPSPQFPQLPPQLASTRLKFFINLCSDPALAMPSMQDDGAGNEQLRVPISAGPVTLGVEKDGETPCLVTDIVLNPNTLLQAGKDKDFRAYIAGFALQKVQQKYHCTLEESDLKFPKLKYKGSLPPQPQRIRRPKGAHVEEERNGAPASAEDLEERRRAAHVARIEALRAAEERESGISMGTSKQSAASTGDIFTSSEAAAAAEEADAARSPADRFIASKESPRIEVVADEPAPPRAASTTAATAAASQPSSAAPAAAAVAAPAAASSSLPSHTISYIKAGESALAVPASEWDLESSDVLPNAVRVVVVLPLLQSASEVDVDITAEQMQFPFLLDSDRSECKFSKKTRSLTLTLPVTALKPLPEVEPAPEQTPSMQNTIDWQAKLGLTNTLMYELSSEY